MLIEGNGDGLSLGRSYRDAPEIDGMVIVDGDMPVRISGAMAYDMSGTVEMSTAKVMTNAPLTLELTASIHDVHALYVLMDEIANYNIKRWAALAQANALFTRPYLNLDVVSARAKLDPEGRLGEIKGKAVLCLAGGGGQQSAAFALLGAVVTVVDLSEEQLQRDRQIAAHYHIHIETRQGDMRDLSDLPAHAFDLVWQPYSLNFVPDAQSVFREVARVLRPEGLYHFNCANPFSCGLTQQDWTGIGYLLRHSYQAGSEITYPDQPWVYESNDAVPWPREYRHTLSNLINGLIEHSFVIRHVSDYTDFHPDPEAKPGTWEHFTAIAPPWLTFWASYGPSFSNKQMLGA